MKKIKIAFTGHRPGRLYKNVSEKDIIDTLDDFLNMFNELSDELVGEVYCGMAQGFDQLAAKVALKKLPNAQLVCAWPYRRTHFHPDEEEIKQHGLNIFLADKKTPDCWDVRDRYMVDQCDILIAAWDGIKEGGTWKTIEYAQKKDKHIFYLGIGGDDAKYD